MVFQKKIIYFVFITLTSEFAQRSKILLGDSEGSSKGENFTLIPNFYEAIMHIQKYDLQEIEILISKGTDFVEIDKPVVLQLNSFSLISEDEAAGTKLIFITSGNLEFFSSEYLSLKGLTFISETPKTYPIIFKNVNLANIENCSFRNSSSKMLKVLGAKTLIIANAEFTGINCSISNLLHFENISSLRLQAISAQYIAAYEFGSFLYATNIDDLTFLEINFKRVSITNSETLIAVMGIIKLQADSFSISDFCVFNSSSVFKIIGYSNSMMVFRNSLVVNTCVGKKFITLDCTLLKIRTMDSIFITGTFFNNVKGMKYFISTELSNIKVLLNDIIIRDSSAETFLSVNFTKSLEISNFYLQNNKIYDWVKDLMLTQACGTSIKLTDIIYLNVSNITISSTTSLNTPSGIILSKSFNITEVTIKQLICMDNTVYINEKNVYQAGICFVVRAIANIVFRDSVISGNTYISLEGSTSLSGGSVCLDIRENRSTNLKLTSTIFIGNKADIGTICLKYEGSSIEIDDAIFENNTFSNEKFNFTNDAGAMNIDFSNLTIQNTIVNGNRAFCAAGIKMVNILSFNFQIANFKNLTISNNYGDNTPAIEFHITISILKFQMTDSSIMKNFASVHAVISSYYTGTLNTTLEFKNMLFQQNIGQGIGSCFLFASIFGEIKFFNSKFMNNSLLGNPFYGGTIFILWGGTKQKVFSSNCIYENNYSNKRSAIILAQFGSFYDTGSLYRNNTAKFASCVSIEIVASGFFDNITFIQGLSKDAGTFQVSTSKGKIEINNTKFQNCFSQTGGSVLTIFSIKANVKIYNTTFLYNEATLEATVIFAFSNPKQTLWIENCSFIGNFGGRDLVMLKDIGCHMVSVNFSGNLATILSLSNSYLKLEKTILDSNIFANKSALFKATASSELDFEETFFSNAFSLAGPFLHVEDSSASIINCKFENCNGTSTETSNFHFINCENSMLLLKSSEFLRIRMAFLMVIDSNFTIEQSKIIYSETERNYFIYILNPIKIYFGIENFFSILNAPNSLGVVRILNKYPQNRLVTITASFFHQCRSIYGAFYIKNVDVTVSNTSFEGNSATDSGGAIHLESDTDIIWVIRNCSFQNNYAQVLGGAIKFSGRIPKVLEYNKFEGNSAPYGVNLISFPTKILINLEDSIETAVECVGQTNDICNLQERSGKPLKTLFIFLKDFYNQTYFMKNINAKVQINEEIETNNTLGKATNFLEGLNIVEMEDGRFVFDQIVPYISPNSTVSLSFILNIPYDKTYMNDSKFVKNYNKISGHVYFDINVRIKECIIGEVLLDDWNLCYECPHGYYSLEKNAKSCELCMPNAKCFGGSNISISAGYWRSNKFSKSIYQCLPMMSSCKGGEGYVCEDGYGGLLCSECSFDIQENRFFKSTQISCIDCSIWRTYLIILVFVLLGVLGILIYFIYREQEDKDDKADIGKLLSTHLQFLTLVHSQGLKLPKSLKNMTTSSNIYLSIKGPFNFISCAQDYLKLSSFQINNLIILISMLACIILPFVMWNTIGCIKNYSKKRIMVKIASTLVVLTYFLNSNYVILFVQNLNCVKYEDKQFLVSNLEQECWTFDHVILSAFFTIPMLVFFMLLQPIYTLYMVVKSRKAIKIQANNKTEGAQAPAKNLEIFEIIVKYYSECYRDSFFYWEFLLLSEKYLMILLPVFVPITNVLHLLLYIFLVLSFLIAHIEVKPYKYTYLHQLQSLSLYVILFTYTLSIPYYISESEETSVGIFWLVTISNSIFFLFWGSIYYQYSIKTKFIKLKNQLRGKRKLFPSSSLEKDKFAPISKVKLRHSKIKEQALIRLEPDYENSIFKKT